MIGYILRFGIIAGVIVATPMIWQMVTYKPGGSEPVSGMLLGYLTMLVALTAVFIGIKQYRDKVRGGVIKFGPAFALGLGISAVASLLYMIGWEISMALSDFDFSSFYASAMIDGAKARGASAAELQKVTADAAAFTQMYANPVWRMCMTFIEMFPVGILISLISAALLRNSRLLPARVTS
jgi:Protein of unknown function (DUF4199)